MTATQKHDIIPVCTTVLSADQQPKEDIMLDQQKITILYCRLSNEDAQDGESNSIANQREYLTRYARDHGYTNLKILVDDGYTGTNFNRPGVQEGFELVKQGLDRDIVDELIDHIEIGERSVIEGQRRQDIKIFYRFVGVV